MSSKRDKVYLQIKNMPNITSSPIPTRWTTTHLETRPTEEEEVDITGMEWLSPFVHTERRRNNRTMGNLQDLQQASKQDSENAWYKPAPQICCGLQETPSGPLIITDNLFYCTTYSPSSTKHDPGKYLWPISW